MSVPEAAPRRSRALVLLLVLSVFPVIASAMEPGITVTTRPDVTRGGRHFDLHLSGMELPLANNYLAVQLSKDGRYYYHDPDAGEISVRCDSSRSPAGSFFMPGAVSAGAYELEIIVCWTGGEYRATAIAAEEIDPWWEDHTVVDAQTNMITGKTSMGIRFHDVPAEVDALRLDVMVDTDFNGFPDTWVQGMHVEEEAPGVVYCSTGDRPLRPLCVVDANDDGFCVDEASVYHFAVNGIVLPIALEAVFYPLSRWEEGRYFAEQHYAAGWRLEEYLDLDAYLHGDPGGCQDANHAGCFDIGYYSRWLELYRDGLAGLMDGAGVFRAEANGSAIEVEAFVPRLPLGDHGFRVAAACYPAGDPAAAVEVDLTCDVSSCASGVFGDRRPGTYELELRVYNNHPETVIYDAETNDGYVFGNYLFATIRLGETIVIVAPQRKPAWRWTAWQRWWQFHYWRWTYLSRWPAIREDPIRVPTRRPLARDRRR